MAPEILITDPTLRPILAASHAALAQTLDILSWLSENVAPTPRSPPSQEAQLALSKQQKKLYALLAQLRGQNRRAAFGVRATKQETAEARQEVDRLLLQLQNLYYEQRHLMGEIGACEGYEYVSDDMVFTKGVVRWLIVRCSHAYTHLPLLPLQEYLSLFPDQADLPEHELMPLQIDHEKQEREKLEQQRLELVKVKEGLVKENSRKKEELRKIDERLEAIIDGFKLVEETMAQEI